MMTLKTYLLQQGITEDLSQNAFPAILKTWQGTAIELPKRGTHFGYVYRGHPQLSRRTDVENYLLHPGMYFCLPGRGSIGGDSSGIVVTCLNYWGLFSLGGPIESMGRFAYINGGTSSLLIPPIMLGAPCLHAVYFPPGIDQTLHKHPSYRIGIVVEGRGEFETRQTVVNVEPGTIFLIPADSPHKFRTVESKLILVMFHPDSDTGSTHQDNPMLNRTIVDGVSAAELPQLQTEVWDG